MQKELIEKTNNILSELEKKFFDIPFENSDYQNKTFVMQAQLTPARAYRSIGLRMFSKIQSIKELKYTRQLEDIDIEELQTKILDQNINNFDRRRYEVEVEKKLSGRGYTDKLLSDAIHELDFLYLELKKFPSYTREQFEREEVEHFTQKLTAQIESKGNGSLQSLATMQIDSQFNRLVDEVTSAPE